VPAHHEARRRRLATALSEAELDAVLVTHLLNVRYLSGFTGSAGALLVFAGGDAVIATDRRYEIQVVQESPDVEAIISREENDVLTQRARERGAARLGFEDLHISVADWSKLSELEASVDAQWHPVLDRLDGLRRVKDEVEIKALRRACQISNDALEAVYTRIQPGVTELDVARWIDDALRDGTPEGPGFDTIVAAGEWGAVPHHQPSGYVIAAGDFVTIDFGAKVDGYHADMTRTLLVGGEPNEWQKTLYDLVQTAQAAGLDALSPTASPQEVDRAARQPIEDAGMGEYFSHGLGHGVGLQIHEAPFLGASSTDKLDAGVPVTVEPGIYVPGQGGVRIEDTVVVHEDHVERLTTFTRDLLTVG
jgi:Xaa-Pro aminopeptidase